MLRIKQEVNLQELEKFGFVRVKMHKGYKNNRYYTGQEQDYIIVDDEGKDTEFYKLLHSADWDKNNNLDTLYDLIKADLVEKVEE